MLFRSRVCILYSVGQLRSRREISSHTLPDSSQQQRTSLSQKRWPSQRERERGKRREGKERGLGGGWCLPLKRLSLTGAQHMLGVSPSHYTCYSSCSDDDLEPYMMSEDPDPAHRPPRYLRSCLEGIPAAVVCCRCSITSPLLLLQPSSLHLTPTLWKLPSQLLSLSSGLSLPTFRR